MTERDKPGGLGEIIKPALVTIIGGIAGALIFGAVHGFDTVPTIIGGLIGPMVAWMAVLNYWKGKARRDR